MGTARQSVATLMEILAEATGITRGLGTPHCRGLASRIADTQAALSRSPTVSADVEQEIVSLWTLARLEQARSGRSSTAANDP